jgi:hypothetical protein
MPSYSIWIGRLLVLVGIVGYGYGLYAGNASLTAFIPAVFGIVLMILGHLARTKEPLRKHLMHAAVAVALLGFILPMVRLIPRATELTLSAPVISQLAMAFLCLAFVVLAIRSFMAARRSG